MIRRVEFVVIGGGVAGAAIGHLLARRRKQVHLLYRGDEGSSFTNQKWKHSGLLYPNREMAREAWRAYRQSHPMIKRFVVNGGVSARFIALDRRTLSSRERAWRRWGVERWGLHWSRLRASEYADLSAAAGGFRTPDCVVDFPKLIAHLRKSIRTNGGTIISGAEVVALSTSNKRVTGVLYRRGGRTYRLGADVVVLAAGWWSAGILSRTRSVRTPRLVHKKCVVLSYPKRVVHCEFPASVHETGER